MKIVIAILPSLDIQGIYHVLSNDKNHQCIPWQVQNKTIYDILYETKPDLLIVKKEIVQPHFHDALDGYSTKLVILEDVNLKPAGNLEVFSPQPPNNTYESDILYINLVSQLPRELLGCLKWIENEKYSLKIVGTTRLPTPHYLGVPSIDDIKNFLASTKICIIHNKLGLYDAVCMRTFCLCNTPNEMMPHFSNFVEFQTLIKQFIDSSKQRTNWILKAQEYIMNGNTYKDRVQELFEWAKTNESKPVRTDFLESIQ